MLESLEEYDPLSDALLSCKTYDLNPSLSHSLIKEKTSNYDAEGRVAKTTETSYKDLSRVVGWHSNVADVQPSPILETRTVPFAQSTEEFVFDKADPNKVVEVQRNTKSFKAGDVGGNGRVLDWDNPCVRQLQEKFDVNDGIRTIRSRDTLDGNNAIRGKETFDASGKPQSKEVYGPDGKITLKELYGSAGQLQHSETAGYEFDRYGNVSGNTQVIKDYAEDGIKYFQTTLILAANGSVLNKKEQSFGYVPPQSQSKKDMLIAVGKASADPHAAKQDQPTGSVQQHNDPPSAAAAPKQNF